MGTDPQFREHSNAKDMRYLRENIFSFPIQTEAGLIDASGNQIATGHVLGDPPNNPVSDPAK